MSGIGVYGVCSTMLLLVLGSGADFLGGTVSWMFQSPPNTVRLTYRLSWEKGTGPCGPGCDPSDIGSWGTTLDPALSSLSWKVKSGNQSMKVSDVNYVMTSVSVRNISGWEHGENRFYVNWTHGDHLKICVEDIPWIISGNGRTGSLGYMETTVISGQRNDTGRVNTSPYVSIPAYIGIPYHCSSTIHLPVEDMDGDRMRCRLAMLSECGGACTNIPTGSFSINQTACSVTIHAYSSAGHIANIIYRLTLVVEDYPLYAIQMGTRTYSNRDRLSTVPIQLTVRCIDGPCRTGNDLVFVRPTPSNNDRTSFTASNYISHLAIDNSFYMQGHGALRINESEVMFSGPAYFNYSYQTDDGKVALNRTNVVRVKSVWTPKLPDQIGPQQFCVWGVDTNGITTDSRCMTSIVGDDADNCATGKARCGNLGTCVNVFKIANERCDCPMGYRPPNCSEDVHCYNNPCYNNAKCITIPPNSFYCMCQKGYTGSVCYDVIHVCDSNPCMNNGTCLEIQNNNISSFKCVCNSMFTGSSCQDDISSDTGTSGVHTDSKVLIIHIIVGLILALIILILVFLLIRKYCQNTEIRPHSEELSKHEENKRNARKKNDTSNISIYNGEPNISIYNGEPADW